MYLIIGLGNPEKKYEKTRHNAGFLAVDFLLNNWTGQDLSKTRTGRDRSKHLMDVLNLQGQTQFKENKKLKSLIAEMELNGQKIILAKPQTYMNNSGMAVAALMKKYNITNENLIIIYDELDLPFATIRVKLGGSSAGHNGIKSIIENIGAENFWRARLGISNEKRELMPADKFVLSKFSKDELDILNKKILPNLVEEIKRIVR